VPTALAAVLLLHVTAAATWLGAALWMPGDVRRTLAMGPPHTDALARRARPALSLDLWAGLATLITGLVAIGLRGGVPRAGIVVGLFAVLVRLGLLALGVFPAYRRVVRAVGAGDLAAAEAPARRLAGLAGAAHLLWVVALAGMIFTG
jgi:hypothetical protein